ncbi:MAG: T9SS type A sorting domain-containing protein [Flavobacteriales bacterium]|nr:T9SS type A sorting domain-containing protein [Flavobacteriales bacterium]
MFRVDQLCLAPAAMMVSPPPATTCTANCVCAGQPIDCLGVPGGTATIGSACNDGNANTINDVYDANCVCAGTPVVGCVNNEVSLTFNTDANAVQTTWNIVSSGTQNVACSGGGFANNSTITVTCCLPNGCYDLQVFDSMGDGINPGGFVLRDANNNRILDNANNGAAFTSLSKAATSFCVPLGTDAMAAVSCDNETLLPSSIITATANAAVTAQYNVTNSTSGYQFWIFNPNGGYTRRVFLAHNTGNGPAGPTKCTTLKLSDLVTLPVPQNVLLNVRVRSRVAGVYAEFGPACRMKIAPPACATTKLIDTPGNPNFSCGVTRTFGGTQYVSAFSVVGANKYQFRFERVGGGFVRTIAVNTPNLTMNWNALPLVAGNTYNVTVRISYDGGANYCPYDGSCTVAIVAGPGASAQRSIEVVEEQMVDLQLFPNPNRGEQLFLALGGVGADTKVELDVMDLFGKRVFAEQFAAPSDKFTHTMDVNGLASGVYLVNVRVGDRLYTERLVKQ